MRFIKDIHKRFTRLNQNQRIILLATAFLIVLNCIIVILTINIISRVLEKVGQTRGQYKSVNCEKSNFF